MQQTGLKKCKIFICVTLFLILGFLFTYTFLIPISTEPTNKIFIYGTLKYPIVRNVVCWCKTEISPIILENYRKEGLNIKSSLGSKVEGGIISVSTEELRRIDRYERVPNKYLRETVEINDEKYWVYVLNEDK